MAKPIENNDNAKEFWENLSDASALNEGTKTDITTLIGAASTADLAALGLPDVIAVDASGDGMTASSPFGDEQVFGNSNGLFFNEYGQACVATQLLTDSDSIPGDGSVNLSNGTFTMDVNGDAIFTQPLTVGSSTWTGSTMSGAQTFTGQIQLTGQAATDANSAMNRELVDRMAVDSSLIWLRDDFMGLTDAGSPFGELGWTWLAPVGSGTMRPAGNSSAAQFGVASLVTSAAFRASLIARFDVSNVVGGGGFDPASLQNSTTRIKFRFKFTTLNCCLKVGLHPYSDAFRGNRQLGLRYTKPATAWTALQAVTLNEYRRPTAGNNRRYYASAGGTTGAAEPTWPTTPSGTVVDGTVTWTEGGRDGHANLQFASCTTADGGGTFVDTGTVAAAGTWYEICLRWITGTTWGLRINGGTEIQVSYITSGATVTPWWGIESVEAVAQQLDMDFFGMVSRITRP